MMSEQIKNALRYLDPVSDKVLERPLLALVSATGVGILIGIFISVTTTTTRTSIPGMREGIMLIMNLSRLSNPQQDLMLRGKKVRLLRKNTDGDACIIPHVPLVFAANERLITLSGSLSDLESLVISAQAEDFQRISLMQMNESKIGMCKNRVKVVYGQE